MLVGSTSTVCVCIAITFKITPSKIDCTMQKTPDYRNKNTHVSLWNLPPYLSTIFGFIPNSMWHHPLYLSALPNFLIPPCTMDLIVLGCHRARVWSLRHLREYAVHSYSKSCWLIAWVLGHLWAQESNAIQQSGVQDDHTHIARAHAFWSPLGSELWDGLKWCCDPL